MSLAGSRGGAPLWGLGQRPNCSTGDQFQGSRQQRRRQRSVPATNFARPQTRPQAAHSTTCTLSRQMGATDQHRETIPVLVFFIAGDFASADATRGLSARPLDPFGLNTSMLDFIRCKENELPQKAKNASRQSPCAGEDCRDACTSSNYSHAASNASKNSGQDQVPHDAILSFFTVN